MKRKEFMKTVAAGSIGAATFGAAGGAAASPPARRGKVKMVVGCQSGGISDENLQFKARHGVFHFDPGSPRKIDGVGWDIDDARRQVEACEKWGIKLEAFHLSHGGTHFREWRNIMLGRSPERDREIEMMQQMIEVTGRVGVPMLLYNSTILPVLRTGRTVDLTRGNASYSTWDYEEALRRGMHEEMTEAGVVDGDELYERLDYWLSRILPVAEEYNVKMGNHIADPPVEPGYRGITRWNSPDIFEGIKRFAALSDSPMHGFNLCVGSTAEGLENPREEIYPILRWLGERDLIFNVHLRNIKGGWNYFEEVFPDNGVMNFVEVVRVLHEVGYEGMLMPDHVPQHPHEGSREQAFAYAYGYIKALLQMVETDLA